MTRLPASSVPGRTLAERWAALKPHLRVVGPPGRRPTVLLFHGCGGLRPQLDDYAAAAAALGWRAVIVDSYRPRGWSRWFGLAFVCSGLVFWGRERAGDVLAAIWGAARDLEADPARIVLAGFSHGGWSVMDLMTMPLEAAGEAGLADAPAAAALADGVKGLVLGYPYGGVGALTRSRPWRRAPRVLGVIAERDSVTSPRDSDRLFDRIRGAGVELEVWRCPGAHCFDETQSVLSFLRYDEALAAEAVSRFAAFLTAVAPALDE